MTYNKISGQNIFLHSLIFWWYSYISTLLQLLTLIWPQKFCGHIMTCCCRRSSVDRMVSMRLLKLLTDPSEFWTQYSLIQMILFKAIQMCCLCICNENETRLLRKNFYHNCNFYRTIKICSTITFVKMA